MVTFTTERGNPNETGFNLIYIILLLYNILPVDSYLIKQLWEIQVRNTTLNYTEQQLTKTNKFVCTPLDVPRWAWAALLVKPLTQLTPRAIKEKIALVEIIMLLAGGFLNWSTFFWASINNTPVYSFCFCKNNTMKLRMYLLQKNVFLGLLWQPDNPKQYLLQKKVPFLVFILAPKQSFCKKKFSSLVFFWQTTKKMKKARQLL